MGPGDMHVIELRCGVMVTIDDSTIVGPTRVVIIIF